MVDWSALEFPVVLLPAAVVESREGHGVGAAPATVRLTGDVVAEISLTCRAQVLLAAVALQRALVRLADLQSLDDLVQREHSVLLQCSARHDALVAGTQNVNSAIFDFSTINRVCQAKGDEKTEKNL
ncbi:MAG: hypothetical protein COU51_01190 [Parcubacteria group bacterium CG10_big_fil_rev_8_21_14_0_10_36_14]|nr:MAG: hypothetical protein COU51_01190 [Parcubacteria group bacterium CG10_big_fil_rev_8_21_14_0_10_36_14]